MGKDDKGPMFYVYQHVEEDGTVVYVGKGSKGRAWDVNPNSRYSEAHRDWMEQKILDDKPFVKMVKTRLLNSEALSLEREIFQDLRPLFNKLGKPMKKVLKKPDLP